MRFLPGFYDVFDDMFDDGWMSPSTNAMQCDIKEVDNNYEMNIALVDGLIQPSSNISSNTS